MNRICIGVLALTPEWISMLDSLGVRYEEVRFENNLTTSYSVLIVNKHLQQRNFNIFNSF